MKRHKGAALVVVLAMFLLGTAVHAQSDRQIALNNAIRLLQNAQSQQNPDLVEEIRLIVGGATAQQPGGRGGPGGGPGGGLGGGPGGGPGGGLDAVRMPLGLNTNQGNGAWWTNPALVQRLGLTDDQKAKLDRAFENHRQNLVANTAVLEKEEAQLAKLLATDPIDRNAVLSQTDRVIQARGELERLNSAMTLEMRSYLTLAQWMQLQPPQRVRVGANVIAANLLTMVEPAYPEAARQAGIQGAVILETEISREGLVESVKVISGPPQLIQAAVDAVKQWRYKPTMLNGQAVAVITTINVSFPFNAGSRGAPAAPQGGGQRRGR